jgi:hypothetical protein
MGTKGDRLRWLLVPLAVLTAGLAFPAASLAEVKPLQVNVYYGNTGSANYDEAVAEVIAPHGWTVENASACTVRGDAGHADSYTATWDPSERLFVFPPDEDILYVTASCPYLERVYYTTERVRRWDRRYKSRWGTDTSSRDRRGNCYISSGIERHSLSLDCWGSGKAKAKWRYNLPNDARRIRTTARGYRGCCSSGRLEKGWSRKRGKVLLYKVAVTGWREYTVRWTEVSYKTRVTKRVRRRHVDRASGYGESWT